MNQQNIIDDAEEASFSLNGMVAGFDEKKTRGRFWMIHLARKKKEFSLAFVF